MANFRPPQARLDSVAQQVGKKLHDAGSVEVLNPDLVKAIVRAVLHANLEQEHQLEVETLELLKKHGQEIYAQGADFQKLLREGKKVLAKKKGFVL